MIFGASKGLQLSLEQPMSQKLLSSREYVAGTRIEEPNSTIKRILGFWRSTALHLRPVSSLMSHYRPVKKALELCKAWL